MPNRPVLFHPLRGAKLWRCSSTNDWQKTEEVPELLGNGAHVWLCPLAMGKLLSFLLSAEETERARNFLPESKAIEFIHARGWLRLLLSLYVAEPEPEKLRLSIAEGGKPFAVEHPSLHFNLSHSGDFAAIAISRHEVGIDIEKLKPVPDWRVLAEGILHAETISEIAALRELRRSEMFLRHFTAREAFLKAVGTGFSGNPAGSREISGTANDIALPAITGYLGYLCTLGH